MKDFAARASTALVLGFGGFLAFTFLSASFFILLLGSFLIFILIHEWPQFKVWWLTPLYPVVPFLALMHLYLNNPFLWSWLVVVVAGYDTGAYVSGNIFGTIKIAPHISPGKTIQGLVGGMLFAGIIAIFIGLFLFKNNSYDTLTLCLAGLCVGLLAFFGDLFESYLKRYAGLKDSGNLLPGHGGILDRIDGLLLAALVVDIIAIFWKIPL